MIKKMVLCFLCLVSVFFSLAGLAGYAEGRPAREAQRQSLTRTSSPDLPADFNWEAYVNNYHDLRRAGIDTEAEAIEHWLNFGQKEGRSYHPISKNPAPSAIESLPADFDWRMYVDNYEDLHDIDTKEQAAEHWLKIGKKEGRTYRELPIVVPDVPYMPWKGDR